MGKETKVVVTEPSAFDKTLHEQLASSSLLFVYVIGARDDSGKSWCPDCVKCMYLFYLLYLRLFCHLKFICFI